MGTNAESISSLIETHKYLSNRVDKLGELEGYLNQQIENDTYDFEANHAILKLYQFHPEKINLTVVTNILIKALTVLPKPHFLLAICLIPESVQTTEEVSGLMQLFSYLETAQFKKFWSHIQKTPTLKQALQSVPSFTNAIRKYMVGVLKMTYQTISKEYLASLLNLRLTNEEASAIRASKPQTSRPKFPSLINEPSSQTSDTSTSISLSSDDSEDDGATELLSTFLSSWPIGFSQTLLTVTFPLNSDNQPRPKQISQNLSLEQMSKILSITR
jgi:hypothetical protein